MGAAPPPIGALPPPPPPPMGTGDFGKEAKEILFGVGGMLVLWEVMKVMNGPLGGLMDKAADALNKLLSSGWPGMILGLLLFLLFMFPGLRNVVWRMFRGIFERGMRATGFKRAFTYEEHVKPLGRRVKESVSREFSRRQSRRAAAAVERAYGTLSKEEQKDVETLRTFERVYREVGSQMQGTLLSETRLGPGIPFHSDLTLLPSDAIPESLKGWQGTPQFRMYAHAVRRVGALKSAQQHGTMTVAEVEQEIEDAKRMLTLAQEAAQALGKQTAVNEAEQSNEMKTFLKAMRTAVGDRESQGMHDRLGKKMLESNGRLALAREVRDFEENPDVYRGMDKPAQAAMNEFRNYPIEVGNAGSHMVNAFVVYGDGPPTLMVTDPSVQEMLKSGKIAEYITGRMPENAVNPGSETNLPTDGGSKDQTAVGLGRLSTPSGKPTVEQLQKATEGIVQTFPEETRKAVEKLRAKEQPISELPKSDKAQALSTFKAMRESGLSQEARSQLETIRPLETMRI